MTKINKILLILLSLLYLVFIIFIYIGGGFITDVLFNSEPGQLTCINLNDKTRLNIAKMSIVIFWIIIIPLSLLPLLFLIGYGKNLLSSS